MANPNAPHQIIIRLVAETQELTHTGECCGRPTHTRKEVITINAENAADAEKKLNEAIDRLKG